MEDTLKQLSALRADIQANNEPTQRIGLALQCLSTAQRHLEAESKRKASEIVTRPGVQPETRKAGK